MEGGGGEEGDRIGLEAPACLFCGEPELLDIGDIWADGAYTLDTCCPGLLENVCAEMHDDPRWARDLLRRLGAELLTGQRLRRVCDDNGFTTMLDYKLQVRPISFRDAAQFVGRHHSHSRPPLTWRFGFGVWNGRALLMGVAMIGNPVARALMGRNLVEVLRLCVRRDTEPMLRDGCCSKLYAAAARHAEHAGFSRIITYTTILEDGASVRAAGWVRDAEVPGRGWHSARRPRSNASNAFVAKIRWSRTLRPKPPARASLPQAERAPAPDWIRLDDAEPRSRFGIPFQLTAFAEHRTGEARTDALLKKPVP